MKILNTLVICSVFLFTSCSRLNYRDPSSMTSMSGNVSREKKVDNIIAKLQSEIYQNETIISPNDSYYDMTAYLGTHITSMYFLSLMWTGDFESQESYKTHANEFKKLLFTMQQSDGGWYRVLDINLKQKSDLSATITNYWFLKSMNVDITSIEMTKARAFIVASGGLDKADMLTKIFLASFGQFAWNKIPAMPYLIFNKKLKVEKRIAAWLGPHILPMALLKNTGAAKKLEDKLLLKEFLTSEPIELNTTITSKDLSMMNELISRQEKHGSWGGYVIASIFANMSLNYISEKMPVDKKLFTETRMKSLKFLDANILNPKMGQYLGATQDGHVWDTALFAGALKESNANKNKIISLINHLKKYQRPNGGFPFGYDFDNFPDVDDTSEILIAFKRAEELVDVQREINLGLKYIESMQNDDGGFGAFSKNNKGNIILDLFTAGFKDSADIFDESSPDVTGHVLEALGEVNDPAFEKTKLAAIEYLRNNQEDNGAFYGRWGVNYIYGTSAAVSGLITSGMDKSDPMIKNAINWLLTVQNKDGGFGESTLSYSNKSLAGKGVSTPSQTAWALIAFLKVLPPEHLAVVRAVDYLVRNFEENNTFIDKSVTGTGHPNVCYMVYPSYAKAFTLMALSRFNNLKK